VQLQAQFARRIDVAGVDLDFIGEYGMGRPSGQAKHGSKPGGTHSAR